MRDMSLRAEAALQEIAAESPINALRIEQKYGIVPKHTKIENNNLG